MNMILNLKVTLKKFEQNYIETAYRKRCDGSILDPWMKYKFHDDFYLVVQRLKSINSDGPVWSDTTQETIKKINLDYEERNI